MFSGDSSEAMVDADPEEVKIVSSAAELLVWFGLVEDASCEVDTGQADDVAGGGVG